LFGSVEEAATDDPFRPIIGGYVVENKISRVLIDRSAVWRRNQLLQR